MCIFGVYMVSVSFLMVLDELCLKSDAGLCFGILYIGLVFMDSCGHGQCVQVVVFHPRGSLGGWAYLFSYMRLLNIVISCLYMSNGIKPVGEELC